MSLFKARKITGATGTELPNFTNGFNIAGADSGISGFTHHTNNDSDGDPTSPANGDTWWNSDNNEYKVFANGGWQTLIGTATGSGSSAAGIDDGTTGISNLKYDGVNYDFTSNGHSSSNFNQIAFKSDGTKWYGLTVSTNSTIYEYDMSTAWDISTSSYNNNNTTVHRVSGSGIGANGAYGLEFSTDGTKFYTIDFVNDTAYQFNLSTAWDITTASYSNLTKSMGSQDSGMNELKFKPDGTQMFVHGGTNDSVYVYNLSTAWALNTATYSTSFSYATDTSMTTSASMSFNADGTKFFIMQYSPSSPSTGYGRGLIHQWDLSTAYDLSTATISTQKFNVNVQDAAASSSLQDGEIRSFAFGNSGQNLYAAGSDRDRIFQYSFFTSADQGVDIKFYGDRGFKMGRSTDGGLTSYTYIGYWDITTLGNSSKFGDQHREMREGCAVSDRSNYVYSMQGNSFPDNRETTYWSSTSLGNSSVYGDLVTEGTRGGAVSNGSVAAIATGRKTEGVQGQVNTIERMILEGLGANATDFGDLTLARDGIASFGNGVRGVFAGGFDGNTGGTSSVYNNNIDYITLTVPGNATDFGDSSTNRYKTGGAASGDKGIYAGGYSTWNTETNSIDYISIPTTGNAQDFGDLTLARHGLGACANATRICFVGGYNNSAGEVDTIDYITIDTAGNATDFGDIEAARMEQFCASAAAS